jgi:hypothetical protein
MMILSLVRDYIRLHVTSYDLEAMKSVRLPLDASAWPF